MHLGDGLDENIQPEPNLGRAAESLMIVEQLATRQGEAEEQGAKLTLITCWLLLPRPLVECSTSLVVLNQRLEDSTSQAFARCPGHLALQTSPSEGAHQSWPLCVLAPLTCCRSAHAPICAWALPAAAAVCRIEKNVLR